MCVYAESCVDQLGTHITNGDSILRKTRDRFAEGDENVFGNREVIHILKETGLLLKARTEKKSKKGGKETHGYTRHRGT
jgi:hypothetical protein